MVDQSSVPPEKPPAPGEEPDDEGFTPDKVPAPKATEPLAEPNIIDKVSNLLQKTGHTVKASSLKVDHPYGGDGKYHAPGIETLKKLGAGTEYGSN